MSWLTSKLAFKHIGTRFSVVILSVVVVLQLAGLLPLKLSLIHHSNKIAESQLAVGERVFENLLQQNAAGYQQAAQVLAADYAFREAVATGDASTIQSALESYQERIHAEVAYYVSDDGATLVHTAQSVGASQKVNVRLASEQFQSGKLRFDIIDGKPYQLIAVPVKAPIVIGWIVLGFHMGSNVINEIKQLTHLDITLVQQSSLRRWQLVGGTLSPVSTNTLISKLPQLLLDPQRIQQMQTQEDAFHLKLKTLYQGQQGEQLVVVLQESVTQFIQSLNTLFVTMVMLTFVGILLLAAVIWYTTEKMVQPISELAKNVSQMTAGHYNQPISIAREDELGQLGQLFNEMREAIQQRTFRIQRMAFHDELTGLANRLSFMQSVRTAIDAHASSHTQFSVLVLNINRFKPINSVLGRAFGDDLLRHVGQVLKSHALTPRDVVARLDADVYAVLLQHAPLAQAQAYLSRIIRVLNQPVHVQEHSIDVRMSIGLAVYPLHGADEESLLNHAESAQLESKRQKTDWEMYHSGLEVDQSASLTMISDLKEAIAKDQLRLYVQPKIDLKTHQALGGEALIRWQHPSKGLVFPDQFIPFAEQTGVICEISDWILNRVCQVLADYQARGLALSLAVNLSARDLNNYLLPDKLAVLLAHYNIQASALKLEITESSLMQDPERAQTVVRKLAEMGFQIAIDDFGTGYSSLAYLRQLAVQELKIDRSFVMYMDHNAGDASIVKSTIHLAHNLGLKVVAEGIENTTVLAQLAQLGCDEGQGYLIGKPMPDDEFPSWLVHWQQAHTRMAVTAEGERAKKPTTRKTRASRASVN